VLGFIGPFVVAHRVGEEGSEKAEDDDEAEGDAETNEVEALGISTSTGYATRCMFDRGSFTDSSSSLAIFSDKIRNTSRRLLFVR
jgi:hypothetical protein